MRIFLLHHAGGDKYAYRLLQYQLQQVCEVLALELPGRGDRYAEPLLSDIDSCVEDIMRQAVQYLSQPYIIMGVSMGALLAYLWSCRMLEEGKPLPKHLILASRKPMEAYMNHQKIAELPSHDFWQGVYRYGGVPEGLLAHPELMELYEPILRADFMALELYTPKEIKPLPITATLLYGLDDTITQQDMAGWQQYFHPTIEIIPITGGHFAPYEYEEIVRIVDTMR